MCTHTHAHTHTALHWPSTWSHVNSEPITVTHIGQPWVKKPNLEVEVLAAKSMPRQWRISTNKANGGDGIPAELFQILKDDVVKVCTQYVSKFGKSSGHKTGKGQFSFQS